MSTPRKSLGAAFAIALAAGTVSVVAPTASAATDGSNVVINEVYGGGGNSGAAFNKDFVELYNPTDQPIDVTGWTIEQRSTGDNVGNTHTLTGVVPAKSTFLITSTPGSNGDAITDADDTTAKFNFSGKGAIAVLFDANNTEVDLVGWGSASRAEGEAANGTTTKTSIQRATLGVDTDNNAADFTVATPTPSGSGQTPVDPAPEDPTDPAPQPEQPQPGEITPIAEIQGTGATSPFVDKTVTTEGVVTAVYDEGGKNGFFLQTAGTGGEVKNPGDASDGIFVYMGGNQNFPVRGESLRVTGKVSEFYEQTQITVTSIEALAEALEAPKAIEIDTLPAGNEAREPYEGMLVRPKSYTVTNNYSLNNTGDLGLAPGELAHRTPTDVTTPGTEAQKLQAEQDAEVVYLDDGRNRNYFKKTKNAPADKNTPLPYIVTSDGGVKSIRTGDQVEFQTDVVVDYSFDQWRFQPLQPITGKNAAEELPITWEDSRVTAYDDIDNVAGDYSIGFFNVLNYFSTLGKDQNNCGSYKDRFGDPVAANGCKVRGAFSQNAFNDQQAKIVTAINKLDADVLGLSEIENTYSVTGNVAKRDEALQNLVNALNAKEPGKWDLVKSPKTLGTDEDVIRVGFIYQPAKVKPVGESVIFDDAAFTKTARQPLAQEFDTVGNDEDKNFVAVVNHFKSKGRPVKGDEDTGDGQGNNPNVRKRQSEALLKHLNQQSRWADFPTFLVGDFNAYTKEDAISTLINGGFNLVKSEKDYDQASYQFDGQLGSLDHVLANKAAMELVQDSVVWNINGDESVAFEYSRRNYNIADVFEDLKKDARYYGADNPFRSSDHDPVKVGFGTKLDEKDADKYAPEASEEVTVTQGDELPEAKATVKDADQLPADTKFEWTKPANTDTLGDGQEGEITVTYPDESVDTVKVVVNVKPKAEEEEPQPEDKPRYIVKAEVNDAGELVVTYDNGETENLGKVKGADGKNGADGEQGQDGSKGDKGDKGPKGDKGDKGPKGDKGADGKNGADGKDGQPGKDGADGRDGVDGKDGRGVKSFEVNDEGDLIVTYSDDETVDLGKVTGDKGADGTDGKDGRDGIDGEQGPKGDKGDKGETGAAGQDGKDGEQGPKGDKGDTGAAGKDGVDGQDGKDGVDGRDGKQGPKGDKGDTGAAGKDGVDGQDGKDGRGVKSFEVNDEGHLMVTYSDGETVDLGKVTGDATDGKNGVDGHDGKDGENGRGIANLEVNEDGELIATYTDGETQNLGRVVGADGADGTDGKDGQDGKPGKDGEKGEKGADGANAPAGEGSSASDRCLPSVGIMALPLLALIPLGLAATADVPALAPVKEQLNKIGEQLPVPMDKAAPFAGAALAIAAIATLATLCSTEGGSSK